MEHSKSHHLATMVLQMSSTRHLQPPVLFVVPPLSLCMLPVPFIVPPLSLCMPPVPFVVPLLSLCIPPVLLIVPLLYILISWIETNLSSPFVS